MYTNIMGEQTGLIHFEVNGQGPGTSDMIITTMSSTSSSSMVSFLKLTCYRVQYQEPIPC